MILGAHGTTVPSMADRAAVRPRHVTFALSDAVMPHTFSEYRELTCQADTEFPVARVAATELEK